MKAKETIDDIHIAKDMLAQELITLCGRLKMKTKEDMSAFSLQFEDRKEGKIFFKEFEEGSDQLNALAIQSMFAAFEEICDGVKEKFGEEGC